MYMTLFIGQDKGFAIMEHSQGCCHNIVWNCSSIACFLFRKEPPGKVRQYTHDQVEMLFDKLTLYTRRDCHARLFSVKFHKILLYSLAIYIQVMCILVLVT